MKESTWQASLAGRTISDFQGHEKVPWVESLKGKSVVSDMLVFCGREIWAAFCFYTVGEPKMWFLTYRRKWPSSARAVAMWFFWLCGLARMALSRAWYVEHNWYTSFLLITRREKGEVRRSAGCKCTRISTMLALLVLLHRADLPTASSLLPSEQERSAC